MIAKPVACYGLEVPPGGHLVPAHQGFPVAFRITMAALDPTEQPEPNEDGEVPAIPRSTLRIVKLSVGASLDSDEEEDEYLQKLLAASDSDEEGSDDEEPNGGPSDPSKAKKKNDALAKLLNSVDEDSTEEDDEVMADAKPNGIKSKSDAKGKAKATGDEDEDSDGEDIEDSDDDDDELEDFVICTLDTQAHYQQPLDIAVGEKEKVYFVVSGTHTIHLTGNYIVDDDEDLSDDEDEDYGLSSDELDYMDEDVSDGESDELDPIEDVRVTEVDSEEEEVPKLVSAKAKKDKKGKNKRPAEDEAEGLDAMISQATTAEEPKSKKQQKKLKNNKGEPVAATVSEETESDAKAAAKSDKKVQFAKNLEQGPTGSAAEKGKQAGKPTVGVKVIQGVTVDDRKVGTGRTVKNGDTVGVRYIGKLDNGKVFDSNKKGKPFSFKAGKGQVIKGWDIGILGMTIGGERRLTIPANLAYGSKAQPGIPANSTLTFDVKLVEIK